MIEVTTMVCLLNEPLFICLVHVGEELYCGERTYKFDCCPVRSVNMNISSSLHVGEPIFPTFPPCEEPFYVIHNCMIIQIN